MRKRVKRLRRAIEAMESRCLFAAVIYVDPNASGIVHDGSDWANAYQDLQLALATATSGTEIRVADGTYMPGTDRSDSFILKNGVSLFGGYAGDGANNPDERDPMGHPSILSGNIGSDSSLDNSYHVVTTSGVNGTVILDGFTITNGNWKDAGDVSTDIIGAGVYNVGGDPTIRDCVFSSNIAGTGDVGGGAIYNQGGNPTIIECSFLQDYAGVGGAIYSTGSASLLVTECTFSENASAVYK